MLGVDPAFIVYRLNVEHLYPPKPHVEAIKEEVEKLKQAGAIREVFTGRIAKWGT